MQKNIQIKEFENINTKKQNNINQINYEDNGPIKTPKKSSFGNLFKIKKPDRL